MPGLMAAPEPRGAHRPLMAVADGTPEFAPIGLRGFLWAYAALLAILLEVLQQRTP